MSFIVIEHYQFPIRDPYYEGYSLTATEACVLNWHRAHLIQRSVTRWAQEYIKSSPNDLLTPEELEPLATQIYDFDTDYELSFKKEPKKATLEYHLDAVATELLEQAGYPNPAQEDIDKVKKAPQVQSKARERVRLSAFSLSELIDAS